MSDGEPGTIAARRVKRQCNAERDTKPKPGSLRPLSSVLELEYITISSSESESSDGDSSDTELAELGDPSERLHRRARPPRTYALPQELRTPALKRDLTSLRSFFTRTIVWNRQFGRHEQASVDQLEREALRFLGYTSLVEGVVQPGLAQFENIVFLERYLDWLLHTRGLHPSTLVNVINSAVNVLKYLFRDRAEPNKDYTDVPVIESLRQVRRQVEKLFHAFRPPSQSELAQLDRWLPWTEIVGVSSSLRADVDNATRDSFDRAQAMQRLLVLGMYTQLIVRMPGCKVIDARQERDRVWPVQRDKAPLTVPKRWCRYR